MQTKTKKVLFIVIISIFFIFIWLLIYYGLTTITKPLKSSPYKNIYNTGDVYLTTDKATYDKGEQIPIYIHNESEQEFVYGSKYSFEVFKDNKWYVVPYRNGELTFLDIGIILKAQSTNKESLDTGHFKYKEGHYRYVKEIQDLPTSVEFYIK